MFRVALTSIFNTFTSHFYKEYSTQRSMSGLKSMYKYYFKSANFVLMKRKKKAARVKMRIIKN